MNTATMKNNHENILVVDDDDALRRLLVLTLRKDGYGLIESPDGADAVQQFQLRGADVSLVLLDLGMPGMSGYETLAELQIMDPDVKVLVITGLEPDLDQLPGVIGILHKPVLPDKLTSSVRDALDA